MQPCLKIHGLGVSPHRENDSGPCKQPPSPNLPSAELYSGVRAPSAGSAAQRRVSRPKAKQPRNHSAALGESRLIRGADRPWSGSSRPPLSEPTPAAEAAAGGPGQCPRRPAFPARPRAAQRPPSQPRSAPPQEAGAGPGRDRPDRRRARRGRGAGHSGPAPSPERDRGEGRGEEERRTRAAPHALRHPQSRVRARARPSPAEFNTMPTPTPCATPRPAQQLGAGGGEVARQGEGKSARESGRQRETRGGRKRACAPPPASGEAEPQQ